MRSLTLGRFQEIDVKIHPSFGLIVFWVLFDWGTDDHPGLLSLFAAALMVLIVFGLVIAHEFGHGLMARQHGLRVRDITIVPFGGVARIEQLPDQPRIEALVALAGPAVNLALAALVLPLVLVAVLLQDFRSVTDVISAGFESDAAVSLLIFFFFANLTLALFNLLPAFPMDGGRMMRAGLTQVFGRERATRVAVGLGMAGAVMLIVIGLLLHDLVLPALGAFIGIAAWAEGRAVRLESSLRNMLVGSFAVWDRGGISPSEPVALALRGGLRDVVVTEDGKVLGIAWRRDLLQALNTGRPNQPIGEIMDPSIVTAPADMPVYDVHRIMQDNNQWAVPVVEGAIYRGVFTADRFSQLYRHLKSQTTENRRIHSAAKAATSVWARLSK